MWPPSLTRTTRPCAASATQSAPSASRQHPSLATASAARAFPTSVSLGRSPNWAQTRLFTSVPSASMSNAVILLAWILHETRAFCVCRYAKVPVLQGIMELLRVSIRWRAGTSHVKSIAAVSRVKVSADGRGVVSHAGTGMLRECAERTGLSAQGTAVQAAAYRGPWTHAPGAVFADLAAAVAGGAGCIDGVGQSCGDREHVFGPAASTTTMWRLVDSRVDAKHLPGIRAARAHAREQAWAAGAAPEPEIGRASGRGRV